MIPQAFRFGLSRASGSLEKGFFFSFSFSFFLYGKKRVSRLGDCDWDWGFVLEIPPFCRLDSWRSASASELGILHFGL